MSPQSLSAYLSGRIRPGVDVQFKLRALGCDIEWLMTGKSASATQRSSLVMEPLAGYGADVFAVTVKNGKVRPVKKLDPTTRKELLALVKELAELKAEDIAKIRGIVKTLFPARK